MPGGECGGVGPGLRRSSGIESEELAAIEPPCTPPGAFAVQILGRHAATGWLRRSMAPCNGTGNEKLGETGEGASPDCCGIVGGAGRGTWARLAETLAEGKSE